MLSKKEAKWSFNLSTKIKSNYNIKNKMFYASIEFIGGNNEIINISPSSSHSTKITLNEIKRDNMLLNIKIQNIK